MHGIPCRSVVPLPGALNNRKHIRQNGLWIMNSFKDGVTTVCEKDRSFACNFAWEFSGSHEAHPAVLANLPAELRSVFLQPTKEPPRDVVPPGADSGPGDTGESRRVRDKVEQHHHGVALAAVGFIHGRGEGVDGGVAPLKEDMAEDGVAPRIDKSVVAARAHGG